MANLAKNSSVRRLVTVLLISGIVVTSPGCGLMFCGTHDDVTVARVPKGTTVLIDGEVQVMPATGLEVELRRKTSHVVRFEREGYHPVEVTLRRRDNGMQYANVAWFLAGILPAYVAVIVDQSAGGLWYLQPDHVKCRMKKCKPGMEPYVILAN